MKKNIYSHPVTRVVILKSENLFVFQFLLVLVPALAVEGMPNEAFLKRKTMMRMFQHISFPYGNTKNKLII